MVETTLAVGDFITAVPGLWEELRWPLAIIALVVGGFSGIFAISRGAATAFGKFLTGLTIGALLLGGVGLMASLKATVDKHGGGITTGQFGR